MTLTLADPFAKKSATPKVEAASLPLIRNAQNDPKRQIHGKDAASTTPTPAPEEAYDEPATHEGTLSQLWIKPPPTSPLPVLADGELAPLGRIVHRLEVPQKDLVVLDPLAQPKPAGRLYFFDADRTSHTLAALYRVGRGEVAVVSDPVLLCNLVIAKEDNAVAAAHLLARLERPVVIDEFYHGLSVRGNPLWLLTRHPYGLLALVLVLAAALWGWREAVALGPPLPERLARRRSIAEYVEAMAALFDHGRHRRHVLGEVRDGVLWALRRRLRLSPGHESVEAIAHALERRDPAAAGRLRGACAELDRALAGGNKLSKEQTLELARKVTQCL